MGRSSHVWAVAALAACLASLGVVGGDALWLVPLGAKVAQGHVPGSVPYATAPSGGWHDATALGQLTFWALYHALGGARGLVLLQAVGAGVAFGALTYGVWREATTGGAVVVAAIVLLGIPGSVIVTSVGVFSLALFAIVLALLEGQARSPGRGIWLSVPLLALWGNLHGGVLAGWALLVFYLLFARARREPRLAVGVLVAATLALAANPTLWRTPRYYSGVLHSEVARRGEELWAPLGLGALDLLLIAAAILLVALALVRGNRIRLWEGVALIAFAAGTVHVSRNGAWLLFVAAYPAARALRLRGVQPYAFTGAAALLVAASVALIVRGPSDSGSNAVARKAAATGGSVLAEGILGQQVVLAGGRVWLDNPIDAFRRADQRLYLDWLDGRSSGEPAVGRARYVLVAPGSSAGKRAARDPRLVRIARASNGALYRVR